MDVQSLQEVTFVGKLLSVKNMHSTHMDVVVTEAVRSASILPVSKQQLCKPYWRLLKLIPHVVRKAQERLDHAVCHGCLPYVTVTPSRAFRTLSVCGPPIL